MDYCSPVLFPKLQYNLILQYNFQPTPCCNTLLATPYSCNTLWGIAIQFLPITHSSCNIIPFSCNTLEPPAAQSCNTIPPAHCKHHCNTIPCIAIQSQPNQAFFSTIQKLYCNTSFHYNCFPAFTLAIQKK